MRKLVKEEEKQEKTLWPDRTTVMRINTNSNAIITKVGNMGSKKTPMNDPSSKDGNITKTMSNDIRGRSRVGWRLVIPDTNDTIPLPNIMAYACWTQGVERNIELKEETWVMATLSADE
jgi:hypothetical protein